MASASERRLMNKTLGQRGLAQLSEPRALILQLAMFVHDHEHFRQLLTKCDPLERRNMYESLRPHLKFKAHALDVYVSQAGQESERKKLPTIDEAGNLKPFQTSEIVFDPLKAKANAAILDDIHKRMNSHHLTVTCVKCTRSAEYSGGTLVDATIKARKDGWVYSEKHGKPQETCEHCVIH